MLNTPDLYLGTFLILSGFALSLLNLKRLVKNRTEFSAVLLSENILLSCIGIAFVSRAVTEVTMENVEMEEMEERSAEMISAVKNINKNCDFRTVLMSYGPFIVSLVNSFLSLIIDNYMHFRMLKRVVEKDEESTVRELGEETSVFQKLKVKRIANFVQKYFSYLAISLQWILPILMLLVMYPMEVKEKLMPLSDLVSRSHSCMAMLNVNNETCSYENHVNFTLELRKYVSSPTNYIKVYEDYQFNNNDSAQIDSVVSNVYKIVANIKNNFTDMNVSSPILFRKSKHNPNCIKMCFMENKSLILYMFSLAVVSYFVPITISTVILTKIHVMEVQKPNLKTYVSRELLYNVLFWTPAMFNTFLSLILCSYSMNGVRTSLFNVVANVYQAVKNFMNTKYFKDNSIIPV